MAEFTEVIQKKNEMCWCGTFNQGNCPLFRKINEEICNVDLCNRWIDKHPQEAEEIIMTWVRPVDWKNVDVDTPILVRNNENNDWSRRYFSKYEDGKVFAWMNGATSWSIYDKNDVYNWKYTKLAEEGDVE